MTKKLFVIMLAIACTYFMVSCSSKKKVTLDEDTQPVEEETFVPVEEDIRIHDLEDDQDIVMDEYVTAEGYVDDIFFQLDKYNLDEESRRILDRNVRWLKDNPRVKVLIEGHCCDIGTVEYNYALGDRRANAARDYLMLNGIDPARIKTVSYGKMKPFVLGTLESQRAMNRRAHFKIQRY